MDGTLAEVSVVDSQASAETHLHRPGFQWTWMLLLAVPMAGSWLCGLLMSPATELTATSPRPSLLFATWMYHHGEEPVAASETLTSEFRFRNEGAFPVTITEVERSCGCMSPQWSPRVIEPGEVGHLTVPIRTVNQSPGPHEFHLNVHYLDPQPQMTTLRIKAVFPERMLLLKPSALFLSQKTDRSVPFQVELQDYRLKQLHVTSVESTLPFVTADVRDRTSSGIQQVAHQKIEADSESSPDDAEVTGSITQIAGEVSGNLPPGRHHVLIAAHTDDPEFPVVTVPMMVAGPDYPKGQEARLNAAGVQLVASDLPNARREGSVLLTAPASWKISHAAAWPPQLTVRYQPAGEPDADGNQLTRITIQLDALPAPSVKEGVVQLIANEGRDLVTVKVMLTWPEPARP
ncbi:MAG: DUF1573 domain-containing protein [Planctomycetaceae bacterium]